MKKVRLVWEVRASMTSELVNLMRDFNVVHSVHLSREEPSFTSDVTYTRLFGKGKHNIYQFTDDELVEIDEKALKNGSKNCRHVLPRYQNEHRRRKFPQIREDEHQGWKVVDATPQKRVHLSDLLSKIPEKNHNNLDEVVQALEAAK